MTFPDDMSEGARDLSAKLLDRDPDVRMQEVTDFKSHSFFGDIDWDKMMKKELPVPFKPDPSKLHFDDEFTSEPARHSMAANDSYTGGSNDFENFTYYGRNDEPK